MDIAHPALSVLWIEASIFFMTRASLLTEFQQLPALRCRLAKVTWNQTKPEECTTT